MAWSIMQNKLGLGSTLHKNAVSILASIGFQNNSGTPCSLGTLEEFGCYEGGVSHNLECNVSFISTQAIELVFSASEGVSTGLS